MVNGIDDLAVTNLDGLDTLEKIQVCVAYRVAGKRWTHLPNDIDLLARCQPIYREFPGWRQSTSEVREWKQLPAKAREYLKAIADLTEAKLSLVSIGPGREQTIVPG